jgi:hypothetical protein
MDTKSNIYRIMGALLILDVALLVVSGLPTIKQAEHGWKGVVGGLSWGGFLLDAAVVIVLATTTLVRRKRIGKEQLR